MTDHVVQFSGGAGSWATARRVRDTKMVVGDRLHLLFADTKTEDEDLYRFIVEAADDVGGELITVADGRDIWEVFEDVRFLGNSRVDPCSRILKRDLLRQWIDEHYRPLNTVIYLGIDWTEIHRFERARKHWEPVWDCQAPLCDPPCWEKTDILLSLQKRGIKPPRLYELGFPHNNCGGFCVKAGIGQFAHLYRTLPMRYAFHEAHEELLREHFDKPVAVMKDRRGGVVKPMTMRELRHRVDSGENVGRDFGGCGCAVDYDEGEISDG